MRLELWQSCYVLFPLLVLLHLHIAPYTKVEESFNIQAIHDIIEYGVPISDVRAKFDVFFDHMKFPGPVPRTFIGALLTAVVARPFLWLSNVGDGLLRQKIVRGTIGMLNAAVLVVFTRTVRQVFGGTTALFYTLFQASQFHIWYYASRTLPNMFAFPLSTLSLALLLPEPTSSLGPVKRMRLAFYFLSLATIIFRSELSLLIGAQALYILIRSPTLTTKLSLIKTAMLPSVIPGVVISLLLTVGIDTYFWQSPTYLWPELSAFLFNILPPQGSGGASDWGTSPWYWYLTNALPRLMMFQYPLLLLCAVNLTDRVVKDLLTPNLLFVLLYSNLPHKETRFLFSVVPPFALLAALIATKYYNGSSKSLVAKSVVAFSIAGTLITSVLSHAVLLPLSAQNYPGGHALRALHEYHHAHHGLSRVSGTDMDYTIQPRIQVYMTNLALQSGVTRFLEQPVLASSAVASQVQPDASPKQYEMIKGKVMEVPQHAYQAPRHNTRPSKFEPLTVQVAPGQEPLTIYPQDPQASASPFVQDDIQQRMTGGAGGGSEGCVWVYDKSCTPSPSANSTAQLERFWSAFSYAIVESPCPLLAADLPFTIAGTIYALDSLKLYRPHELRQASGPSLLQAMYGQRVGNLLSSLSTTVHDTLRYRVLRGYWLEFSYVPKLYIVDFAANQPWEHTQITKTRLSMLCSSSSSSHTHLTNTNDSAKNDPNKDSEDLESLGPLGLPADSHTSYSGPDSNLDALGPLVVNKDGSLSRLDNWTSMTEQERQKLLAFLRKRNKLRVNG